MKQLLALTGDVTSWTKCRSAEALGEIRSKNWRSLTNIKEDCAILSFVHNVVLEYFVVKRSWFLIGRRHCEIYFEIELVWKEELSGMSQICTSTRAGNSFVGATRNRNSDVGGHRIGGVAIGRSCMTSLAGHLRFHVGVPVGKIPIATQTAPLFDYILTRPRCHCSEVVGRSIIRCEPMKRIVLLRVQSAVL